LDKPKNWEEINRFIDGIEERTCSSSQTEYLYRFSKRIKGEGAVVEIGTNVGKTAIAMAFAQKEKGASPFSP
jgi:predicted O-methyltransferase YrrM